MRHFEDIEAGCAFEIAEPAISRAEIMEFARAYDPQPWHLDDEAARKSVFGALCASGWHSSALIHRICLRHVWPELAGVRLRFIHEMRWVKPLLPDTPLTLKIRVSSIDPDPHGPEGQMTIDAALHDGDDVVRVSTRTDWLVLRRNPGQVASASRSLTDDEIATFVIDHSQPSGGTVWFEDLPTGVTRLYGSYPIGADEISRFRNRYDLAGSDDGRAPIWLIAAAWMRMTVDYSLGARNAAAMGSPGFRTMEWLLPVYAGDTLSARVTSTNKVELKSRQDVGFIHSRSEVLNQHGQTVMRFGGQGMVRRRPVS